MVNTLIRIGRCFRCLAVLVTVTTASAQTELREEPKGVWKWVEAEVGGRYAHVLSGSTRAQEFPRLNPTAPSYDLKDDLGVHDGYAVYGKLDIAITAKDRFRARGSHTELSGDKRFEAPIAYNDRTIPAGPGSTTGSLTEVDTFYEREIFVTRDREWRASLYAGFRQLRGKVKIDSDVGDGDQEELTAWMVPAFGAEVIYQPAVCWTFTADVSGAAPGDIFEISAEPADVSMVGIDLQATYWLWRHAGVSFGARVAYTDLHFEGPEEDGLTSGNNQWEMWTLEPYASITIAF